MPTRWVAAAAGGFLAGDGLGFMAKDILLYRAFDKRDIL
jgi:hypothetical protein